MTNFALTEAERLVKHVSHDFAVKEIAPAAAEYDEREEFPWDIARKGRAAGSPRAAHGRTGFWKKA